MNSIKGASKKILEEYMQAGKDESVLIVCDNNYFRLGKTLLETAISKGFSSTLCIMKERDVDGEDPTEEIGRAMLKADVIIIATKRSLTHCKATIKAAKKGARIASMPSIDERMIRRTFRSDPDKMEKTGRRIKAALSKASIVRVVTKKGTDITMNIKKRKAHVQVGRITRKGEIDNLPGGEVSLSPLEGSSSGRFIVDASMAGIGKIKVPIEIKVERGMATSIKGGKEAAILRQSLKKVKDSQAYNIAELGIGVNPFAKISGSVLEDEKVKGTAHIALGNNKAYGGKVGVAIHLDGVMRKPTIYADNKKIMENGRLLI